MNEFKTSDDPLSQKELETLFNDLIECGEGAEAEARSPESLKPFSTKKGRLTPKARRFAQKSGAMKTGSKLLEGLSKETPAINVYLMEGSRFFTFENLSVETKEESERHYIDILYTIFTESERVPDLYDSLIKSFSIYGHKQKPDIGEIIAAVNIFSYFFPRSIGSELDEIVDNIICSYIRVNGIRQAKKFYENAEMMTFATQIMKTEQISQMFNSIKVHNLKIMDIILSEKSKLFGSESKSDIMGKVKLGLTKVYGAYEAQYQPFRRHAGKVIQYIDALDTLSNISDDGVGQGDWDATGDLYLEYTQRKSRSFPWVSIDMQKELGGKQNNILHLRTIEEEESDVIAIGNIRVPRVKAKWRTHLQKTLITDGFFPSYDDNEGGEVDYSNVYYGIPFGVKKDGEIEIYGGNNEKYKGFGVTGGQLSKVRAYILWYLAQLTNAEYEIISPKTLTKEIKEPGSGKNPEVFRQMPGIRPVVKNPDILPPKEGREIDYRSPHTRLLPAGWTPSATQYLQGQDSNMALFAYIVDKKLSEVTEICRIDLDKDGNKYTYEEFLELCDTIRKQYERGESRVRLQTYVKKFDRGVIRDTQKIVAQVMGDNTTVPNING